MPRISLTPTISDGAIVIAFDDNYTGQNKFGVPQHGVDLLRGLKNIAVRDDGKPPFSTPSVFRRPIDFYNVLKTPDIWTNLSEKYKTQWREMLTLLALNDLRGFDIRFEKIPLDNPPEKSTFLTTCASDILMPKDSPRQFGRMRWRDSIYVIIFQYKEPDNIFTTYTQKVIGATSPTTLFFPAEDFDAILAGEHVNVHLDALTQEELKCVFDWLVQFKVANNAAFGQTNTTLTELFNGFIVDVQQKLTPAVAQQGWSNNYTQYAFGHNSRFSTEPFNMALQTVDNGVEPLNFSIKKNLSEFEWYALFAGLALNDLMHLGLHLTNRGFENGHNGVVAHWMDYCTIAPVENAAQAIGLGHLATSDGLFNLSKFEWLCVWQYLIRLSGQLGPQTPVQLTTYVNNFQQIAYNTCINAHITPSPWPENRFSVKEPGGDARLALFNYSVHSYVAPFYEDSEGGEGYSGPIVKDWFNLLYLIALRNLRDITIEYTTGAPQIMHGVSGANQSPLCRFEQGYVPRAIRVNNETVAITCCDTLFTVLNTPQATDAINRAYAALWSPTAAVVKEQMRDIGPCMLYEFEIVLLIQYLKKIIDNLNINHQLVSINGHDFAAICQMINGEILRLSALIPQVANPVSIDFKGYYRIGGFAQETGATVNFFYASIVDQLYESMLIMFDTVNESDLVQHVRNGGGRGGALGSVYVEENGTVVADGTLRTILPFVNSAAETMYSATENANKTDDSLFKTTLLFDVDYVETYSWDYNENGQYTTVFDVCCKCGTISVPMIKRYFRYMDGQGASSVHLVPDGAINLTPSVSVWPDVEIECWKEYYVNVVQLGPTHADCQRISIPTFLRPTVNVHNEVRDINYMVAQTEGSVTVDFMTYKVEKYPRVLKLTLKDANGVERSGCLFTRPYSVEYNERDQEVETAAYISDLQLMDGPHYNTALVGIDFGTTNSTAYIARGIPVPALNDAVKIDWTSQPQAFSLLSTESNYLTIPRNVTPTDSAREITEMITSQRHWVFDSKKKEYFSTFSSTLVLYAKKTGKQQVSASRAEAFSSSNIYRMSGSEISNFDTSILKDSTILKYGMKWDLQAASVIARENFLSQFVLMCCVFAVKRFKAKKIEIRASYPTSLSSYLESRYEQSLENICQHYGMTENNGVMVPGKSGLAISLFKRKVGAAYTGLCSESLCSGLAGAFDKVGIFGSMDGGAHQRGLVCVDIGGGSTDISVLQGDQKHSTDYNVTAHLSLPFAAQYIFSTGDGVVDFFRALFNKLNDDHSRSIINDPAGSQRYKILFSSNARMIEKLASSTSTRRDDPKFKLMMDTFIANIAEIIKERGDNSSLQYFLRDLITENNSEHMKRLSKIKMATLAILYFIGLMLKKLMSDPQAQDENNANQSLFRYNLHYDRGIGYVVDIYLAGNGSRVFDWVTLNGDEAIGRNEDEKIKDLFARYVKDALMGAKDFNMDNDLKVVLHRSSKPKHESAYGLLYVQDDKASAKEAPFDPVDVDSIIYEYNRNNHSEFLDKIKGQIIEMQNEGKTADDAVLTENDLNAMSDVELYTYLTKLVNPDFTDDNLIEVVCGFMESFANNSPHDFNRLFPNVISLESTIKNRLNDRIKATIHKRVEQSITMLRDPVNMGNTHALPLAVRSFNGYAILKYVTYILKN